MRNNIQISNDNLSPQLSCSARMSYHSVRSSQTGPRRVVSPSKFQLVLQISKSLSSVAALSKFQLVLQISKSLSSLTPTPGQQLDAVSGLPKARM
ncbi:hypothetical protein J6590_060890 [Homalodisca vitripennis]|nr:hypothetical protein J6590_060890 [Homalodisca vitripennis]